MLKPVPSKPAASAHADNVVALPDIAGRARLGDGDVANATLPPEAPMAMPLQDWRDCPVQRPRLRTSPSGMDSRRRLLIGLTALIGIIGGIEVVSSAAVDGMSLAEWGVAALFVPLFAWIAFGFMGAVIGFVRLASGQAGEDFALVDAATRPLGRTAILVPIYNEDVDAVFARMEAMAGSIAAEGETQAFDMFVLSDSKAENGVYEEAAFEALAQRARVPTYYRRRPINHERKPGNIAEWVRRFGRAYDYMLVLDADSLMSGETMVRLAATMDRHPSVGLLQTVPAVIAARTGFARWQQFAARLYGPIATAGLLWWSGSEASFWGHNAIVRTRAFAASCGLPRLEGPEPFGGHVMSHDMLEAALLRRRGWAVHMVQPDGSYEEYPPSLVDHAIRDRRWCQGNLQHFRVLGAHGFHWVSRLQLLMGGSAYVTSPLWLLLIMASLGQYFAVGADGDNPLAALAPSGWLLGLTVLLLFGPKLLAIIWAMSDRERRQGLGGTSGILASAVIELPLSMLIAPMVMLTQTLALIDILRGRPSGWPAQRRDVDGIAMADAVRHYAPHVIAGALLLVLVAVQGGALAWMVPVALGLLLAPLVVSFTSRRVVGDELARIGLFLVPEEHDPPEHAVRLQRKLAAARAG